MSEVQSFLSSILSSILRKNGLVLSKILSLPFASTVVSHQTRLALDRLQNMDVAVPVSSQIKNPAIASIITHCIVAMNFVRSKDFDSAYKSQLLAYNAIVDFFSNKDENTNWIIPTMSKIANDLRLVAEKADDAATDVNYKHLRESLNHLTRAFTLVARDKTPVSQPGSKKQAIFTLTNILFKVYFKVNTMQLCSKLIGVIEGPGGVIDAVREFPVSDVVMYKYYIGRIRMFEDRFEDARDSLRFAVKYTPMSSISNKQRILAILAPVEMALGIMPREYIASRYGFHEYFALGRAVVEGNITAFDNILNENRMSFVKLGVYLVLEHSRAIVMRNLFRRVYTITKNPRVNLHVVEHVLSWLGQSMSLDEIECVLSNLIYNGKVKGYISHEKRFLVVSKTDPFPTSAIVKPATAV